MIPNLLIWIKKNRILVLILLVAVCLRFIGTRPSYNMFHSDEGITYDSAVSMIKNNNLDPLRYDYPALVPLVNYIFFKNIFIPIAWTGYYLSNIPQIFDGVVHFPIAKLEAQRLFQVVILGEREVNAIFWGRYVTGLISFFNVILTYFLAKKLFNRRVGLFAVLLLAVNFKAVVNSHIGLPDTYNAFFLLLSLIFSYRIMEAPTVKNYLLAGIFIGLSFSVKYQIFAIFPFLVAHLYTLFLDWKKLFSGKILLSALASIFVFVIINPYLWLHYEEALVIISYVSKKYMMGRMKLMTYPFYYSFNIDYGPIIFISVILGSIVSFFKYFKQILFLLVAVLPFIFVMVYYSKGGFYIRNFITVTPILLIIAAAFISIFTSKIIKMALGKYLLTLFCLALVFVPLKNSIINSYYYLQPWTYKEILVKSTKVLPKGSVVASHPFDPLPDNITRTDFERSVAYSLSEFREEKADYALINMDWASDDFYGWMLEIFPNSLQYWQKPISAMRNTFSGVAIEEMMDYVLIDAFKPWQAPDAAFFLIKVPYFRDVEYQNPKKIDLGQQFPVEPNFVYQVSGLISADKSVVKNKRSAFIQIDFYKKTLEGKEIRVSGSVSARYYGLGKQNLELTAVAPANAFSAKIVLEDYLNDSESYSLTGLIMRESADKYKLKENYLKLNFKQYQDLLYPYSHGNL